MRILALCLCAMWATVAHGEQPVTIVHAGHLLSVPGESFAREQSLVIRDGVIEAVQGGYLDVPDGATLIELRDQYVLPGLIDMHVHLLLEATPEARGRLLTDSDELALLRGAANAYKTLKAGFTTVRDLGARSESIFALRDGISQGLIPGPTVIATGSPLAATGGHGDIDGLRADLMARWTTETICDGPIDCRRAVRHAVKYGADWIKVTATGGVMSDTGTGLEVQMTDPELKEIVSTAHGLGIKVAMHAHGTSGILAALRAGTDTIDHGSFQTRETIALHKKTGAYFVPTLLPGFHMLPRLENSPIFSREMKVKARQAGTAIDESFKLALRHNVRIAFGTDTGVTPHGYNAKEFELMVAKGMTPMAAIRSATVVAAKALSREDRIGTLEAGKQADLIGVVADPVYDITELQRVRTVIKNGQLVH